MDALRAEELRLLNEFIAAGKMRVMAPRVQQDGEEHVNAIYGTPEGITIGTGSAIRATGRGDQDVLSGREAEVLDAVWTEG